MENLLKKKNIRFGLTSLQGSQLLQFVWCPIMEVHHHQTLLDVWRFTTVDGGVQCVMMDLVLQKLVLLVVNWDSLHTTDMDQYQL